jgi:hypothetical protein
MSIKRFFISSGDGDMEESELDSSGIRTIGYDDVEQRVQLSKAYVIGNLYVSGSIIGNLTGSVSGSASGGSENNTASSTVTFKNAATALSVGNIVSVGSSGLAKCNNSDNLLSNAIGVVYSSGSSGVEVQVFGEATVSTAGTYSTGSVMYAGINGEAVTYDQLTSGKYVTQVGIISGNGIGKLIIQPRIFGQL